MEMNSIVAGAATGVQQTLKLSAQKSSAPISARYYYHVIKIVIYLCMGIMVVSYSLAIFSEILMINICLNNDHKHKIKVGICKSFFSNRTFQVF